MHRKDRESGNKLGRIAMTAAIGAGIAVLMRSKVAALKKDLVRYTQMKQM